MRNWLHGDSCARKRCHSRQCNHQWNSLQRCRIPGDLLGQPSRFCLLRRKHTVAAGSGHIHQWIKCLWGELKYFDQCRNFKSLCRNHQRNRKLQYPSSYPKFSTGLLNDHIEISGRLATIQSDGYIDRASSDLTSYFLQGIYQDENTLLKALVFGGHEITYQSWFGVDPYTLENDRTYNFAGEIYDAMET